MDDIQTFQATKRQINVGFVIPAFDADDARCNLAKVTSLMRKLYPHYSGEGADNVSTLARSPLMRIRFANLIRNGGRGGGGLLGKVNGFSFTPNLDHGFFDYTNVLYPKTIDISFTFDVLHEHILGWTDTEDEAGNANIYNITIKTDGSETIDGVTSVVLESPFASISLYSNGSNKFFIY